MIYRKKPVILWISAISFGCCLFSTFPATAQDCSTYNAPPRQAGLNGLNGITTNQTAGVLDTIDRTGNFNGTIPTLNGMSLDQVIGLNDSLSTLNKNYGLDATQIGTLVSTLGDTAKAASLDKAFGGKTIPEVNNLLQAASQIPGISSMDTASAEKLLSALPDADVKKYFPGQDPAAIRTLMGGAFGAFKADPSLSAFTFDQIAGVVSSTQNSSDLSKLFTTNPASAPGVFSGIDTLSSLPGLKGMTNTQISTVLTATGNLIKLDSVGKYTNMELATIASVIPGIDKLGPINPADATAVSQLLQTLHSMQGLQGMSSKQIEGAMNALQTMQATLPGLKGMDVSALNNLYQNFAGIQQLGGINIAQTTSTINNYLGGDITTLTGKFGGLNNAQISDVMSGLNSISGFQNIGTVSSTISSVAGGISGVIGAFPIGTSTQTISAVISSISGTEIGGVAVTDINSFVSKVGSLSKTEEAAIFNGINPTDVKNVITNLGALGGGVNVGNLSNVMQGVSTIQNIVPTLNGANIQNIFTGIAGIPSVASGNIGISQLTGAIQGVSNLGSLQGLGGLNNTDLSKLFGGLGGITSINGLQGLNVSQIGGLFQGIEGLQGLSQLGTQLGGLGGVTGILNGLSPDQMGSLFKSFPQLQNTLQGIPALTNVLGNLNLGNISGLGTGALKDLGGLSGAGNGSLGSMFGGGGGLGGFSGDNTGSGTSGASGLTSAVSFLCPMAIDQIMSNPTSSLTSMVGGGSFLSGGADNSAKEALLRGDNVTGVKSNGCMVAKTTPRESFLNGYTSWLYKDVYDPEDNYSEGMLSLYRAGASYGSKSDMTMLGMDPSNRGAMIDGKAYIGCKLMFKAAKIDPKTGVLSDKVIYTTAQTRYILDNCANQYILNNTYVNPSTPFIADGAFSKNLGPAMCQPLRMIPYSEKDYDLKQWIDKSWDDVLGKSPYPGLPFEGAFVAGMTRPVVNQKGGGATPADLTINSVITGVERIYDPSHPFSPRQYFNGTERQTYSPLTAAYREIGPCTVACAGVPVDLMKWRKPGFNQCILIRIAVNTACMNNYYCRIAVGNKPPCSTRFDRKDRYPGMCGEKIKKCCNRISKPLAPANALKLMKNDGQRPEGYVFKEYFGDHRPYMRWWDTGTEAGKKGQSEPDLYSKEGSKDAIVGVGTEKQSCKYGGQGSVNPLTSWMELKLYQARTFRDFNLNCLGNYEKLYKWGAQEDLVLSRAGGEYTQQLTKKENKDINSKVGEDSITSLVNRQFPLGWRGYVSDINPTARFPELFSRNGVGLLTGLDNVLEGDIIIYDSDVFGRGSKRLPHVAYVTQVQKAATTVINNPNAGYAPTENKSHVYIKVVDYNHGKFPDVCGVTDQWGMGQERTIYKAIGRGAHESLPREIFDLFQTKITNARRSGGTEHIPTMTCEDPDLVACIEPLWNQIKIYRPRDDVR